MFMRPALRLVRDDTRIKFMRGRFMGLIVSAILSSASVALFFYPGLNLGIDFKGGIVMEARTPQAADYNAIRGALAQHGVREPGLQRFGDANEVLIRLEAQATDAGTQDVVTRVRAALEAAQPGTRIESTSAVGASVSAELFRDGLLALGISLLMILVYIWFRFEWQFAVGAVVDPAARRDQGGGLPGGHPLPVRPGDDRRDPDHHRLLDQRQGGGVRPHARELAQVQGDAAARADRPLDQRDAEPHAGHVDDGVPRQPCRWRCSGGPPCPASPG